MSQPNCWTPFSYAVFSGSNRPIVEYTIHGFSGHMELDSNPVFFPSALG